MEEDCDRCAIVAEVWSQKSSLICEKGYQKDELSERGKGYKFCTSL